jgi:tape measure domain-containing protein
MNNTIEFVLRMRDMMSSNITRVSSASQSAFNRMTQSADQVTRRNQVLGMSFNELQSKIRDVENTISRSTIPSQIAAARRELASLQRMSSNHAGNVGGSSGSGGIGIGGVAVGSMIGGLATAGVAMAGSGLGSIVQGAMNKETNINGMSTFLGNQGANTAYANIEKDAEATPFDTQSLLEVNRSLISAGANAKAARTDSMNLANAIVAVGGTSDTLTRMAANMQQIKTVGKATAMDVRQFGIAGINIYALLAKSTGKSIDQVKEMDVTYEQLSAALSMSASKGGLYYGALENAQNSMQGKWSNFQEKMINTLARIGVAFMPLITGVIDIGTAFLNAGSYIVEFANWINSGTTSANIFIATLGVIGGALVTYQAIMAVLAIKTGIVTAAQWLLNIAMTANPIGIVVVAIGALIAGLAIAYNRFSGFRSMVDGVWGVLKQVGSNIMGMFSKIPNMIIEAFTQIPKAILKVFSGVGNLFSAIFSGNFKAIPGILSSIGGNLLKTNPITGFATNVFAEATKGTGSAYTKARNQSLLDSKANKARADKEAKVKESTIGTGAALASSNAASSQSAGSTVAGAGPKVVNITVGKFFDNLQFTTLNAGESANEIEKIVMECFSRVVYNGSKMV